MERVPKDDSSKRTRNLAAIGVVVVIAAALALPSFFGSNEPEPEAPQELVIQEPAPEQEPASQGAPEPSAIEVETPSPVDAAPEAPAEPTTATLRVNVNPSEATLYLDGEALPGNPAQVECPIDDSVHVLRAEAPGFEPEEQRIRLDGDLRVRMSLRRAAPSVRRRTPRGASPAASSSPEPRASEEVRQVAPAPPPEPTPAPASAPALRRRALDADNPFATD
jgi:hypothetical protein